MNEKENYIYWYEREKWLETPGEVREILTTLGKLERMLEDLGKHQRGEEIIRQTFDNIGKEVNVIPNGIPGPCLRILVVAIGSGKFESVEKRILQAIEHIGVKCRGITKYVIFWAAKWDASAWIEHANSFKNVTVILKPFRANPTLLR